MNNMRMEMDCGCPQTWRREKLSLLNEYRSEFKKSRYQCIFNRHGMLSGMDLLAMLNITKFV